MPVSAGANTRRMAGLREAMKENLNVRLALSLGLGLLAAAMALVMARHATLPFTTAALGAAQIVAGVVPTILFLAMPPERRSTIPLLALSGLFYAAFFGFPVFLAHIIRQPGSGEILTYHWTTMAQVSAPAQLLALAGLGCLYAGFALMQRPRLHWVPSIFRIETAFSSLAMRGLAWGLMFAHVAYLYFPAIRNLPSVGQFLQPAGIIAVGLLYVFWRRGRLALPEKLLFGAGIIPFIVINHVTATLLTPLIFIGVFLLALETWLAGRVPWKTIAVLALAFVVGYPAMTPVRERLWLAPKPLTLIEKVNASVETLRDYVTGRLPGKPGTHGGYRGFTIRIGQIFILSYVYEQTPQPVPYWQGETYKPLFTSFIPRLVWPGKPRETVGAQFGQRYGIVRGNDDSSINLPWLTEMYVNFGVLGVFVGMVLAGMLIGLLQRLFCHRHFNDIGTVVGAGLCLPLFYQESNFSLMTGSLLPLTVCIILYFAAGRRLLGGDRIAAS